MDGWMDGSIHQMLLYFVPCTTYVCMYVCIPRSPLPSLFTDAQAPTSVYSYTNHSKKEKQIDRQTERTNERNGTKERNRKEQKTKTKSQKKKSVSISNHLLITMNNLNMDGWNRLIFIPISPLYSFPIPIPIPICPFLSPSFPFPIFF